MKDNFSREINYLRVSITDRCNLGQCYYHADIVERYCRKFRIRGRRTERPRGYVIDDQNWAVAGGGRWNWYGREKRLRLHGESLMYGPCDLVVLWERLSKVPEIADWYIEIEPVIHY